MGMRVYEYLITCPVEVKQLQHSIHVAAFAGTGEEFTVGKSTRATFAETVVRFGVQSHTATQQRNVAFAAANLRAAFNQYRPETAFDEFECSKQSRRPCAYNYHFRTCTYIFETEIANWPDDLFAMQKYFHRQVQIYVTALSGIHRSAEDIQFCDIARATSCMMGDCLFQQFCNRGFMRR
jgi:hypothetical protein